ncbi:MAG: hypothetical protein ACK46Q_06275 [Hyphomonas sp.]
MVRHKSVLVVAVSASFLAFAAPLAAAQSPAPMDPVYACRNISEDAERLACFDNAIADLFQKQQAGQVQTIDTAAIQQLERESFGFSMPSLPSLFSRSSAAETERASVNEIVEPVRSARLQAVSQKAVITLQNGQVWEQIDTTRVNSHTLRRATEARIRRAALGSFMLSVDGSQAFRVRRIS